MRIPVLFPLLLATTASGALADAPRVVWEDEMATLAPPQAERRNAATIAYDQGVCAWRRALGERIAADADPNVAWAGAVIAVLATCRDENVPSRLPPRPTTGVGRLMWHTYCAQSRRCGGTLEQWRAAEPDNLFVLGLSARASSVGPDFDTGDGDESCGAGESQFSRATRYDDYYEEVRALTAGIVARYGFTPPPAPADFDARTSETFYARSADFLSPEYLFRGPLEEVRDDSSVSTAERLRFADLLIAVKGSPYAVQHGAQLGALAATGLAERDRYCRLALRGVASDRAVDAMVDDQAAPAAVREFHRLLRDGNALDAIETVAASLPVEQRPKAVDPAHVAACVVHGPGFDVESDLPVERPQSLSMERM